MKTEARKYKRKISKDKHDNVDVRVCPEGMTIEEWQRSLRQATARKENFSVNADSVDEGLFHVASAKSNRLYTVHYFGAHSERNRCSCMDFRTNGLGTCKHIEAISCCNDGKYAHRKYSDDFSYVFVDYPDSRTIKIHLAPGANPELEALAKEYFNDDGSLKNEALNPVEFINKAKAIDQAFKWEDDAMEQVIEKRDALERQRILKAKYNDSCFDGLLKTNLLPYQVEGVKFAFGAGRTIIADEMGLGKTVQAIATAELLLREGMVDSVLIICPTSLKYQWLSEIKRFTGRDALVIEGDVLKRHKLLSDKSYFYKIASYQAIANNIKARLIPSSDMIIYDELQRLKNRDTQTGRQLRKLSSEYVLALTGTPLENNLEELYSVAQLVDQYAMGPLYKLAAETMLKDPGGRIIGYRNLHSVAQRLRGTLLRRRKAEVKLQMPSRTDTNTFVPMTDEQMAIHDENKATVARLIFKWRRQKFLSEKDRRKLLLALSIMRMVCDSTFIIDQESRHDTKIDETLAIISNLLACEEGKVVIFSQWERMLRILAMELQKQDVDFCFLHGAVPSPKRKDLIDRFREDPECRIFLSTDAGGTGLNLQAASLLINLDLPWNPAVLEQRIARIYRLGQENPVQIINMIARDTIEERMLDTLAFKSNLAAGILDGGDDAVFLNNKTFDNIASMVETIVEPEPTESPVQPASPTTQETDAPQADRKASETEAPGKAEKTASDRPQETDLLPEKEPLPSQTPAQAKPEAATSPEAQTSENVHNIVAGGMKALGQLAQLMSNPESAQTLADALVKEDRQTGQCTLNIPVPDKETVVKLFSAIATILRR